MKKTGITDFSLHYIFVPERLYERMSYIALYIFEGIVSMYGKKEFLRRLRYSLWFQSLDCFMGREWHSSGITTSVFSDEEYRNVVQQGMNSEIKIACCYRWLSSKVKKFDEEPHTRVVSKNRKNLTNIR